MRIATLVAASLAAIAVAAPASASADTLAGSQLVSAAFSEGFTFSGTCNADGPSTFEWRTDGEATGPHAGAFSASGTVTLASPSGPVSGFDATFDLYSGEDVIHGAKALVAGTGTCTPDGTFEVELDGTYDVLDPFTETGPARVMLAGYGWSGNFVARLGPEAPTGPRTKDDCKNGGWQTYGFPNQGQCIKAVNHA